MLATDSAAPEAGVAAPLPGQNATFPLFSPSPPPPRPRPGAAHALITMAQCPHISWPRAPHADILIPGHGLTTALLHPSLTAFQSRRRGISSSTYPHKVIFSH